MKFVDITTNRPHEFSEDGFCLHCNRDICFTSLGAEFNHCEARAIDEAQQRSDFDARR